MKREPTRFQPTTEQWRCPECGADWLNDQAFHLNSCAEDGEGGETLYTTDIVVCDNCCLLWTGAEIAELFDERTRE